MEKFNKQIDWQSFITKEKIHEQFESAKNFIERFTGLELSNIECVGLKKITEEYMNEFAKERAEGISWYSKTIPYAEIPERFFRAFYDMRGDEFDSMFPCARDSRGMPMVPMTATESTKKYFKELQAKKHLI